MQDFFEFGLGARILYKAGLVREMSSEVLRMGFDARRALIVADKGVIDAGLLDQVKEGLQDAIEIAGLFEDVPANSSVRAVEAGAALAIENGADFVVAVGGGSPLDTAKCIRILMTHGGQILDYQGYNVLDRRLVPMVAIPTTIGTGSEVTPYAMILDEEQNLKVAFASSFLAPDIAILDPEMTRTLPAHLAAATGMDALSHAIETLVSTEHNPFSDSLALHSIDMISNYLRDAIHRGGDLEARGQMLVAACMAGIACANSLFGVIHALSHAVGGKFHVHHGTLNSIFLPYGMQFNSAVVPDRYVRIALAMGVNIGGRSDAEVIADGIAAVRTLASDCSLPARLRDVGVPQDALEELAAIALTDGAIFNNPRSATQEELQEILVAAW
ncbi:MAG: iron-containing alcohol dehydrogenase [Chloroflexales bacterium]|nr:iron-containing alcohol dehydrogenase [Chloroflexales bacterium]